MWRWLKTLTTENSKQPLKSVAAEPARRPLEGQWDAVTTVASSRQSTLASSKKRQADAAQQIDAAYYALSQIMDELATVMRLPEPQRKAAIHNIDPAVRRVLHVQKKSDQSEAA